MAENISLPLASPGEPQAPFVQPLEFRSSVAADASYKYTAQALELIHSEVRHASSPLGHGIPRAIRALEALDASLYVVIDSERDMTVAVGDMRPGYRDGHLVRNLATHPDYRKRGYGKAVLEVMEADALAAGSRELFLFSWPDSIQFYRHRGFERRHYKDVQGYLMGKTIIGAEDVQ